jgi:CubicO group peptidase (beta-lactamase class C family)
VQQIDSFLASESKERAIAGLSVAILREGKLVLAKGYGSSSLESKKPVDTETFIRHRSVTKQFTSACILLLAEDGKAVRPRQGREYSRI